MLACIGGGTVALPPTAAGQQETVADKQVAKKAEDAFPGEWKFSGGQKGGLTRIVIKKTDDGWSIQAWGSIEDGKKEKDLGKATLHLLRDYEGKGETDDEKTMNRFGFARWSDKIGETHLTLRIQNDKLIGEAYRIFTDRADRPHYRSRYEFKKN